MKLKLIVLLVGLCATLLHQAVAEDEKGIFLTSSVLFSLVLSIYPHRSSIANGLGTSNSVIYGSKHQSPTALLHIPSFCCIVVELYGNNMR